MTAESESSDASPNKSRRSMPRQRKVLLGLGLFAILIFFLPNIVLMTPLKHTVVAMATKDVIGQVEVASMSGGWLQRVQLYDVVVKDADNNSIISAEKVSASKNILAFLMGDDLGTFVVEKPQVQLRIRQGGSNLEDVFANYLASEQPGSPARIQVSGGRLMIASDVDGGATELHHVDAEIAVNHGSALTVSSSGQTINEANQAGDFKVSGTFSSGFATGDVDATLATAGANLLSSVLTRIGYEVSLTGHLSGQAKVNWTDYGGILNADLNQAVLEQSIFASPKYIQRDRLIIGRMNASGKLGWQGNHFAADQLIVESEFAKLNASGTIDTDELIGALTTGQLGSSQFEISGQADVARIAQMLPETIHLHPDVRLDSGKLTFQSFCRNESGGQRALLNAEIQNLVGHRNQQRFSWHHPIRVVAVATQRDQRIAIDELKIESSSLSLTGSGNSQRAEFVTQGDLGAFARDLAQFIDLSSWQLAGKFAGRFRWTPQTDETRSPSLQVPMDLQASFRFADANISIPGWGSFQEKQLDAQAYARTHFTEQQGITISQGTIVLGTGNDRLSFQLTEPVAGLDVKSQFAGQLKLNGDISKWHSRFKLFLPETLAFKSSGQVKLSAQVSLGIDQIKIQQSNYEFRDFALIGQSLRIEEPQVAGACAAAVDLGKKVCSISDFTIASRGAAARVSQTQIAFGEKFQVTGQTAFRGHVNRLVNWFPSLRSDAIEYIGEIEGTGTVHAKDDVYTGNFLATIKDAQILKRQPSLNSTAQPNQSLVWHEPTIVLKAQFSTNDFDSFKFKQLQLQSKALAFSAAGSISDTTDSMQTNLTGIWRPNWQVISQIVHGYTGQVVTVTGSHSQSFHLEGPVFVKSAGTSKSTAIPASAAGQRTGSKSLLDSLSPNLALSTKIKWDRANVIGIGLGQAEFPIHFQNRVLSSQQVAFSMGQKGKVALKPSLDLRFRKPILVLAEGSSLSHLELDPQVCHGWLKYVAPPIADATRAKGTFSIATKQFQLPLLSPFSGKVEGTLAIHRATLNSGPLADQILTLAKVIRQITRGGDLVENLLQGNAIGNAGDGGGQASTWVVMPEQQIPFRLHNRRVYHEGATFQIDDVTVQTRGSVGADHSIQMVASIRVRDQWIEGKPWLRSMKGRSIQVPIGGTLSQPRIDQNALKQISNAFLKQNVGQAINNQINERLDKEIQKGLQKLFGK